MPTYLRDGRAPIPENEVTSKVMASNKDRNTKPEILFRKALWNHGIKGYRLHWKKAPGRPDICWPGKKVAVFVNGCYWHRCPYCDLPLPKSNTKWWKEKFEKNKLRDARKLQELQDMGWSTITIWECRIKQGVDGPIREVQNLLGC